MHVSKLSFSYPVYACIQSIYIVFSRIYLHRLFLVSFEQMGELALLPARREDDQHIYLSIYLSSCLSLDRYLCIYIGLTSSFFCEP